MATTTGFVQRLTLASGTLTCAWVGPEPASAEALTVQLNAADSPATIDFKQSLVGMLLDAQLQGRQVDVGHGDASAEITSILTRSADTSAIPLQVEAMEVTQAVQDLAQSIPLLAERRTVVRLYLSHYGTSAVTVRGSISVRRSSTDPPLAISSDNVVALEPALAGNIFAQREDVTRSLNFVLPATHTVAGPLAIRVSSITDAVSGGVLTVGSELQPVVWFHPTAPLRVRVLGMSYVQGSPPVTYAPSGTDFNLLFSWLGRAYPVSQIISTSAIVAATAAPPFTSGDINAQLAAIRALDMDGGADARTHYYGMVSDGGFWMRGSASGIPATPDPATVACGPTGGGTWGWDFDGSYGDWYGGHELGHTYGRLHPGFCGESHDDLDHYPFTNGQLANSAASFVGFDVGDPANGIPMRALPGTQWHDFMTYCNNQWSSAYTYLGIRRRLVAEDQLAPGAGAAPAVRLASREVQLAAGGRPDNRFPQETIPDRQLPDTAGNQVMIHVVAQVNLTSQQGKIRFVNPLRKGVASEPGPDRTVVIRVKGAGGQVLQDHPAVVQIDTELLPAEDRTGIVTAVLPVSADAQVIGLLVAGQEVDTFTIGGAPQADRATQTYFVQVSTDQGQTWLTVAIGLQDPAFTLDQHQFPAGTEVLVRVVATNGLTNTVISQDAVRIATA